MSKKTFTIVRNLDRKEDQVERTQFTWSSCIICQKDSSEPLSNPRNNPKKSDSGAGYQSISEDLLQFHGLGGLPRSVRIEEFDEGDGVQATFERQNAKWHKSCRNKYNSMKLERLKSKKRKSEDANNSQNDVQRKVTRSSVEVHKGQVQPYICFFCNKSDGKTLHQVSTFQADRRVRDAALFLNDKELLAKLSAGDMIAMEAKYHSQCLANLYNRERAARSNVSWNGQDDTIDTSPESIALSELVAVIEDRCMYDEGTTSFFVLSDLVKIYTARVEELGGNTKGHATRLKESILKHLPYLGASTSNNGNKIILGPTDKIGDAISEACSRDDEDDAIHIARAAQIIRKKIFAKTPPFDGTFQGMSEVETVPKLLVLLLEMLMEGPKVTDRTSENDEEHSIALNLAQLIKYNSKKRMRNSKAGYRRHSRAQETPFPIYLGLKMHAQTRKRELVDILHESGLSISYDRVLSISTDVGNKICDSYHKNGVCPPSLREGLFTTAQVDNIDHNPSSSTAVTSFHGTAISVFQHPIFFDEGNKIVHVDASKQTSTTIKELPTEFATVLPISAKLKSNPPQPSNVEAIKPYNDSLLDGHQLIQPEYLWLEETSKILRNPAEELTGKENVSWAACNAERFDRVSKSVTQSALLPMFQEEAASVSMIFHSMKVVKKLTHQLNEDQTPVLTGDQPLYAIAKKLQWTWPELFGEDKFVVMLGPMHAELSGLKALGSWLSGSGWVEMIEEAGIAGQGTSESFLHASHIKRTRHAHEVTAEALYILMQMAYERCKGQDGVPDTFSDWCIQQSTRSPQFLYWLLTLQFEMTILAFVRACRTSDFEMYTKSLEEMIRWYFRLDHQNYARWGTVHWIDLQEMKVRNPDVYREFSSGKFTVRKSERAFSDIALDQGHEQMNKYVKGDGGIIGITTDPHALRRWMVSGPEISRIIQEFEGARERTTNAKQKHHEQTQATQIKFAKQVQSLVSTIADHGNPFEEESDDLFSLHTKVSVDKNLVSKLQTVMEQGHTQFSNFVQSRFIDKSIDLEDKIPRNKNKIFTTQVTKKINNGKLKLVEARQEIQLFSRLYIACQTRDSDLNEFFSHENHAYPPSLSLGGEIRKGTKSDLLTCFASTSEPVHESPSATATILDGAAIVHIVKPDGCKTFAEYANRRFVPFIMQMFRGSIRRVDLVWDTYKKDSLKAAERRRRGSGERRKVTDDTPMPRNWISFLRVDENKVELFAFLGKHVLKHAEMELSSGKVVVTTNDTVDCFPSQMPEEVSSISPCTHEEADTRCILHVLSCVQEGHTQVVVRTVDTDIVVLSTSVASRLRNYGMEELWISFGTGKDFRHIPIHELARGLGDDRSVVMPLFHAMTGCDTVSYFANIGKKTAWQRWNSFPEMTEALLMLQVADELEPEALPESACQTIEKFVVSLYDKSIAIQEEAASVNASRKNLFASKGRAVDHIPPSFGAFVMHLKRSIYQGKLIWGRLLEPAPETPNPELWGWKRDAEGCYVPVWSHLQEASKSCSELISCSCKKGCRGNCKCRSARLPCTELCKCTGKCKED